MPEILCRSNYISEETKKKQAVSSCSVSLPPIFVDASQGYPWKMKQRVNNEGLMALPADGQVVKARITLTEWALALLSLQEDK